MPPPGTVQVKIPALFAVVLNCALSSRIPSKASVGFSTVTELPPRVPLIPLLQVVLRL